MHQRLNKTFVASIDSNFDLFTYALSRAVEISFLSGRCGQCVRPIKHLPDLHIF